MLMPDGWSVSVVQDGKGYHYTAEHGGLLWASGWFVFAGDRASARRIAMDLGKRVMREPSVGTSA